MKQFIYFFFFISCGVFGQQDPASSTIIANYSHFIHLEGIPNETRVNATLISNSKSTAYEMDFLNNSNFIEELDGDNGSIFSIKPKSNPIIYKDLSTSTVYSKERILSNFYLVKDPIEMFEWKLQDNHIEILGYQCQEAIVDYRGRTYKAYFTSELPFATGPWKFGGLPGFILKVASIDGAFGMTATSIKVQNKESTIGSPFSKDLSDALSWNKFLDIYQKKYNEFLHYRSENGGSRSLPKRNIETFITE